MKHIRQTIFHNEAEGIWGNCHAAALAMVLGEEIEAIPHFCDLNQYKDWHKAQTQWLEERGLVEIMVVFDGEVSIEDVLRTCHMLNPGLPYILGCKTEVANHSVAVYDRLVYNPGDNRIIGAMDDDFWRVSYILRKL